MGVDRILASTKSWRRLRRISLLLGSAESAAADFSQAPLKNSYFSLMVLLSCMQSSSEALPPAALLLWADSPVLYRLIVPACAAEAIFCCPTENSHHLKS
jgi:hypothetical protein